MKNLVGILLLAWAVCSASQANAQSIVSNAMGLGALQDIVRNRSRQEELEISPAQLAELSQLLNSPEVKNARGEAPAQGTGIDLGVLEEDFSGSRSSTEKSKHDIIASALPQLLHPAQLKELRVGTVRKQTPFPLLALQDSLLVQIGMTASQIKAFRSAVGTDLAPAEKERLLMAWISAISDLLALFPDASKVKFVNCFGRDFIQTALPAGTFDESSIGLFPQDRGSSFLTIASFLLRQERYDSERLSERQIQDLEAFEKELLLRFAHPVPGWNPDRKADEWVAAHFSPAQRNAVVLQLHVAELEQDLRVLVIPKIYDYLELPNELRETLAKECGRAQQELDALRLEMELAVFKPALAAMPTEIQKVARELYDEVWCDL